MVSASPGYDPRVYELYTRVMRALPIATYKDDNDFGSFFRKALGLIKRIAPIVGAAFGPIGTGIGALVGAGSGLGEAILTKK